MTFDPLRRFRLRFNPVPVSSEDDSDESSPERGRTHFIHIAAPKNVPSSRERILRIPDDGKKQRGAPEKLTESTHLSLPLDRSTHSSRPERPPKVSPKPGVAGDSVEALQPPAKSTLLRRVTSKLVISLPSRSSSTALRSRPSTRTLPVDMPAAPHAPRPIRAPTLPNSFVSKEHREAALRERGLLPPRKDLSEQEREADERLGRVPPPASTVLNGPSEAEQFKTNWLAMKRTSESSDSDCGHPPPPCLQGMGICTQPMLVLPSPSDPPLDGDGLRPSGEGKTDPAPASRPSICNSVRPLSSSSHLEVLHEEPSEHRAMTPPPPLSPANLSIIISSPLEFSSTPTIVESPTSYAFSSSQCATSTLESQSQSDHRSVPEKENVRLPAHRRRTDPANRGRKLVGSSLSGLGTRSLSNLRRSVAGSLKVPSSSTLSSGADLSHPVVPRTAISPTIHSIGSIIRETRHIEDVESRRLSELAFLD